jgi:hypothetical protein
MPSMNVKDALYEGKTSCFTFAVHITIIRARLYQHRGSRKKDSGIDTFFWFSLSIIGRKCVPLHPIYRL